MWCGGTFGGEKVEPMMLDARIYFFCTLAVTLQLVSFVDATHARRLELYQAFAKVRLQCSAE